MAFKTLSFLSFKRSSSEKSNLNRPTHARRTSNGSTPSSVGTYSTSSSSNHSSIASATLSVTISLMRRARGFLPEEPLSAVAGLLRVRTSSSDGTNQRSMQGERPPVDLSTVIFAPSRPIEDPYEFLLHARRLSDTSKPPSVGQLIHIINSLLKLVIETGSSKNEPSTLPNLTTSNVLRVGDELVVIDHRKFTIHDDHYPLGELPNDIDVGDYMAYPLVRHITNVPVAKFFDDPTHSTLKRMMLNANQKRRVWHDIESVVHVYMGILTKYLYNYERMFTYRCRGYSLDWTKWGHKDEIWYNGSFGIYDFKSAYMRRQLEGHSEPLAQVMHLLTRHRPTEDNLGWWKKVPDQLQRVLDETESDLLNLNLNQVSMPKSTVTYVDMKKVTARVLRD